MPDLVTINNTPYSWTSCAHFMNGLPYKGIKSVSFKDTREVKVVGAAQMDGTPIGITSGIYKCDELRLTMLATSAYGLLADLTLLGLGSYGDAQWSYLQSVFEPVVPPTPPQMTLITGCRVVGVEERGEYGAEEKVVDITIQPMFITRTYLGVPMKLWSQVRSLL